MLDGTAAIFAGAVGLGLLHGIEPGHGWPLAAGYAVGRPRPLSAGVAASVILGVGHLISSIAVVLVFFGLKSYFDLGRFQWLEYAAGALLIGLGLWSLRGGHGHSHDHGHDHRHGHSHRHHADSVGSEAGRGLWSIAGAAFALGFAHEEEFQIIALCAGTDLCLELMGTYALAVILALVALTLLLVVGYRRFEHRVAHLAPYLPKLSGVILIGMGAGFVLGVL